MEDKRQKGICGLPVELQAMILLQTDAATIPLLRCVGHTWNALLRNRRTRLGASDRDADEWYGLRCGITRCACPTTCLKRFATRVSACRRWAILLWLCDLLPESNDSKRAGDKSTYGACEAAAMDGDVQQIQVLAEKGFGLSPIYVAAKAAEYGHYHVIEWLRASVGMSSYAIGRAVQCAAERGHFDIVKRLYAGGGPPAWHVHMSAFKHGDIDMVHWLHDHHCPTSILTCEKMAKCGRLDMLKLARTIGCVWDRDTCAEAAANGHLDVLEWARANACPCDSRACEGAAKNGHLHILEWLRANGCPWGNNTLSAAATGGHLDVIQWAVARGCPQCPHALPAAMHGGHLDVVQWLLTNGNGLHDLIPNLTLATHQCIIRWAYEQGYIWGDRTTMGISFHINAAARGDLDTLQWLWSIRGFNETQLCREAAANGHLHVLVWLRAQHCPWDAHVIKYATGGGHWNVVEWARTHGCPES